MSKELKGMGKSRAAILLVIPLVFSTVTHLWNPTGYPSLYIDEGTYLTRAFNVLSGLGPQESELHDHPYLGQLFLGAIFSILYFPSSLDNPAGSSEVSEHLIEKSWRVPRIIVGVLAIIDTFLIYKIAEHRYNRTLAFISSMLFALAPLAVLRLVLLDNLQLPFILSSIFFVILYRNRIPTITSANNSSINIYDRNQIFIILLSGIFLGLAIFIKIPAFTLIPLVSYFIISNSSKNSQRLKNLGLWLLPVILIPTAWPAYALMSGGFDDWLHGINYQAQRESRPLYLTIEELSRTNPVLLVLGVSCISFSVIKKDRLLMLWFIPHLIFLTIIPYVGYSFLVPLIPAFSIASSKMISYGYSKVDRKKTRRMVKYGIISAIGVIVLAGSIVVTTVNVNSNAFKAMAYVGKYIQDSEKKNIDRQKGITVISNPNYFWTLKYVLGLNHVSKDYLEYPYETPVNTKQAILIADSEFMHYVQNGYDAIPDLGKRIQEIYRIYTNTSEIHTINEGNGRISIYLKENM